VKSTAKDELPFERLGDYDVLAPISEGGMASVWLGRATAHPERFVAPKGAEGLVTAKGLASPP
jgi:hypothetical protein